MYNVQAQAKLREAMTSENKLQHTQAEAKQVADMPPQQKQEAKTQHTQAEAKWVSDMSPEQKQ